MSGFAAPSMGSTGWSLAALSTGRLSYLAIMVLALIVFLVMRAIQPRTGKEPRLTVRQRRALTLAAFVGGPLGAKLPFVLSSNLSWWDAHRWLADGKTITTGLIGAYLAVEFTKRALGIRAKTGDGFAIPLAAALAVGRWGCFFNGCCCGTATSMPWGFDFLGDGPRHPTQIYESLFHAAMVPVLWQLARNDLLHQQRLKFYLIAYFCFRFCTEFIRGEPPQWLGLTFYQWVAVGAVMALSFQWYWDEQHPPRFSPMFSEPET